MTGTWLLLSALYGAPLAIGQSYPIPIGPYVRLVPESISHRLTGPETAPHTALLIHGWLAHGGAWKALVKDFVERGNIQVITPDSRGYGKTPAVGYDFTPHAIATDMAVLLRFLGGKPVHVVGHSLGGKAAIVLAHDYPELVQSLTVLDIPARDKPYIVPQACADLLRSDRWSVNDLYLAHSWEMDLRPLLERVRVPVLFVVAGNDSMMRHSDTQEVSQLGAHITRLRGAGHDLHRTHPKELAEILVEFWGD